MPKFSNLATFFEVSTFVATFRKYLDSTSNGLPYGRNLVQTQEKYATTHDIVVMRGIGNFGCTFSVLTKSPISFTQAEVVRLEKEDLTDSHMM